MNTELFISGRLGSLNKGSFSRPIILVSIAAVALGVTVMLISVSILTGFQKEIREKVIGFSGHIQITQFMENDSFEPPPLSAQQPFLPVIRSMKGVRHVQVFATKPGIIKTKDQIQGVILKGVGRDYDWSFLKSKLAEGAIPDFTDTVKSNQILISYTLARMLNLKNGDDLRMYFVSGNATLGRKFVISGIFNTGLEEFDKLYIFGDIRHISRLNNWEEGQVGGFEVLLDDFRDIAALGRDIYMVIGFRLDSATIVQHYPQIFDWLELQDMNVWIILALMALVSAITMISTLLILILERTATIGILKALGMPNISVRRIFLLNATKIIGWGILWGNLIGLSLCFIQQQFGPLTLPQESYYVPVVPIHFSLFNILLINAGTILLCSAILVVPSMIITRISPVKAIRFS